MNFTENLIQIPEKNTHLLTVKNMMVICYGLSLRIKLP